MDVVLLSGRILRKTLTATSPWIDFWTSVSTFDILLFYPPNLVGLTFKQSSVLYYMGKDKEMIS